jgi:hypothetical protein
MHGEIHHRSWGLRAAVQPPGDRRLHASVFRWDKPVQLSTGGAEWFTRDREPPLEPAVLTLLHGGPPVGRVVEWRSDVLGLDAVLTVHESPGGDGLLELVDRRGELPLSPAFRGTGTRHSTGVQWRHVQVSELAVCAEAELPWSRVRRLAA